MTIPQIQKQEPSKLKTPAITQPRKKEITHQEKFNRLLDDAVLGVKKK